MIRRFLCSAAALFGMSAAVATPHPLTMDDLMGLSSLSGVAVSPDGDWIAATVIRPAAPGEVYGRTFYELDSTRADVWLISRRTGERRRLTDGASEAAGYWCATWSPDGHRLAMLSTKPEGNEPRGGDNVRLYVWNRDQTNLTRVSALPMMTQTLGGSALYRAEMRGAGASEGARCSDWENAPFLWADNKTVLAVTLPAGSISGIIDEYSRGLKHAGITLERLHDGVEPTQTAVEAAGGMPEPMSASLQLTDVETHASAEVTRVPIYPFAGALQVSVAPAGHSAALLAGVGAITPIDGKEFAYPYDSWAVDQKLGFVSLSPDATVRWVDKLPADARYILDLPAWAPDGSAVAIRARPDPITRAQSLFRVSAGDLAVARLSPASMSISGASAGSDLPGKATVMWSADRGVLARAVPAEEELNPWEWYKRQHKNEHTPRADWWLFAPDKAPLNLTAGMHSVPDTVWPLGHGARFVGIADDELWSIDSHGGKPAKLMGGLPEKAEVIWPRSNAPLRDTEAQLVVAGKQHEGNRRLVVVSLRGNEAQLAALAPLGEMTELDAYLPAQKQLLLDERGPKGTSFHAVDVAGGGTTELLALNQHMAEVSLGDHMLIDYRGIEGEPLKGAVMLPPGYQPGHRYPVLVWVYAGSIVRPGELNGAGNYSMDYYRPAEYNLHLYAARGYVVLMPSMPLRPEGSDKDDYIDLPKGVMPAVDRLIELGIADPERLAVMGQSYGGYSTYSLVTYTNRFKAAIALAGITDLTTEYGEFDRSARSYPGMDHQKSDNAGIDELGQAGLGKPPLGDLWRYWRNSPLYFADRIHTPLLLVHGEQDIRGPMTQAEELFYFLYRQGKRARLVRYWGEDHGLRLSPANARNIVEEIFGWLEANMPEKAAVAAVAR